MYTSMPIRIASPATIYLGAFLPFTAEVFRE